MRAFFALILLPAAAGAQMPGMDHGAMPGMHHPVPPRPKPVRKPAPKPRARPVTPSTTGHGAHRMPDGTTMPDQAMPAAPPASPAHVMPDGSMMTGHAMPAADERPGNAPPPPVPVGHAADRIWNPTAQAASRAVLAAEHGGTRWSRVLVDVAEIELRRGRAGYRWVGEASWGGDIDRLMVRSEGRGRFGRATDEAEVQALASHAIGPYFDLQAGIRQDLGRGRTPTYAVAALDGTLPYWIDLEASLFLSNHGDLLGRVEVSHDLRITQRLVAAPRVELNLAAQDDARTRTGRGLSEAELGVRLRYEIVREVAPYVGVNWLRAVGRTADFARARGDDVSSAHLVAGVRIWF